MSADLAYGLPLRIEEIKAAGDAWEVSGYASTFGNVDRGGDVVLKGAFSETLASGEKVRFLYAHDPSQVIGKPVSLREDDKGLRGTFRISKTALGQDVHTLLKDGALDSFSIGYIPREFSFDDSGVRLLESVDLLECSVVAMPMNPQATVTNVKADASGKLAWKADGLPIETVLDFASLCGEEALQSLNGLWERRWSEGQRPSDRLITLVDAYRQKRLEEADALLELLTATPDAEEKAEAQGAESMDSGDDPLSGGVRPSLVDAHLRRARLHALRRRLELRQAHEQEPVPA